MKYNKSEGNDYIQQYPKLKKWINTCICCGQSGYKPDLPETLINKWGNKTMGAYNIRKYFRSLKVNEVGICEECQRVQERREKNKLP